MGDGRFLVIKFGSAGVESANGQHLGAFLGGMFGAKVWALAPGLDARFS